MRQKEKIKIRGNRISEKVLRGVGLKKNHYSNTSRLSSYPLPSPPLRSENRSVNSPVNRDTGLEMPCCPVTDLLWV
jgi:hypothetical protein